MSGAEARERVDKAAEAVESALDMVEGLPAPEPTVGETTAGSDAATDGGPEVRR
jgi:hypothetical protein